MTNSVEASFRETMKKMGLEPPEEIIADHKIHRFAVPGDQSPNSWYILHPDDPVAGAFGCWKRSISEMWYSKDYETLTPDEKARYAANMEAMKRQLDEEAAKVRAECKVRCAEIWKKCRDASNDHPYLKRKGVNAYDLKLLKEMLLVPVRDMAGALHGLQFIQKDGSKRFERGTDKVGHFYAIGAPKDDICIICEGYATGASIHQATGHLTFIAFDVGNLLHVARVVRKQYPETRIILAADDDYATEGNPGLTQATEAACAVNGKLTIPSFPAIRGPKDTDFNDMARLSGLDAVRICIEAAEPPKMFKTSEDAHTNDVSTFGHDEHLRQEITYRRLSDVKAKPISWLWHGRIARGKVSMLAGNPGLGKSQVTASMAAIVTNGGIWPADNTQCDVGKVVFLSAEDDAEDTIRPRLEAAGADLDRVFILDAVVGADGERRSFNLRDDLTRLELMIRKIGGVAMIVIDPISAYLGGADSHKNADIRALLHPLGEMAARHEAAIVCVSHLNKAGGGEALLRVTGSLAFVAAARAAWVVVKDGDDPNRRLFLPLKNNIGNDQTGLAFRIESAELPGGISTSYVLWEGKAVTVTADEAMQSQGDSEERSALEDAKEFLCNLLAEGPVSSKQIRADADGAGYAWATIRRAQKAIGIEATKDSMKGPWLWKLPPKMLKHDEDVHAKDVSIFGHNEHLRVSLTQIQAVEAEDADCRSRQDMGSLDDVSISTEEEPFFNFDEECSDYDGGANC